MTYVEKGIHDVPDKSGGTVMFIQSAYLIFFRSDQVGTINWTGVNMMVSDLHRANRISWHQFEESHWFNNHSEEVHSLKIKLIFVTYLTLCGNS